MPCGFGLAMWICQNFTTFVASLPAQQGINTQLITCEPILLATYSGTFLVSFIPKMVAPKKHTHTHFSYDVPPQKKVGHTPTKIIKTNHQNRNLQAFFWWTHDWFSRFFLRNSPYVFMFRWNFPTPAKQPSMKVQEVSSILGTHQKSWSRNKRSEFPRNENLRSLGDQWSHAAKRTGGENPGFPWRCGVKWREGKVRGVGWYNRRGSSLS